MQTSIDFLSADPQKLSRPDACALLAECKAFEGKLLARLFTTDDASVTHETNDGDRLLKIEETMALLACKKSFLYHKAEGLGLTVKLGNGALRFSNNAIQNYIKTKTSTVAVPTTRGARPRAAN